MNYWYSYLKEEFCIKYYVVIRFTVITKHIGNPVGAKSKNKLCEGQRLLNSKYLLIIYKWLKSVIKSLRYIPKQ